MRGDAIDQLRRQRALVQREQEIDLLIFGHGERIDLVARDVGVAVHRLVGKRDGLGVERRQRFRNFDGAPRDVGDRLGREVDARGKSPRPFGHHAHAEADGLALDRRLQLAIAGDDDVTAEPFDPEVGVGRAALFCDLEGHVGEAIEGQREEGGVYGARCHGTQFVSIRLTLRWTLASSTICCSAGSM